VSIYRAAFPYLKMIVDDEIATEDKIVPRWHSEGTHRGEVAGLAPTGVRASATGVSINQWKDGKVIQARVEWDLGLARQLGAAPPEGSVGEKIGTGVQRLLARRMRRKNQSQAFAPTVRSPIGGTGWPSAVAVGRTRTHLGVLAATRSGEVRRP
jgi:hypothetical protein